jgi:hypothetical protein
LKLLIAVKHNPLGKRFRKSVLNNAISRKSLTIVPKKLTLQNNVEIVTKKLILIDRLNAEAVIILVINKATNVMNALILAHLVTKPHVFNAKHAGTWFKMVAWRVNIGNANIHTYKP